MAQPPSQYFTGAAVAGQTGGAPGWGPAGSYHAQGHFTPQGGQMSPPQAPQQQQQQHQPYFNLQQQQQQYMMHQQFMMQQQQQYHHQHPQQQHPQGGFFQGTAYPSSQAPGYPQQPPQQGRQWPPPQASQPPAPAAFQDLFGGGSSGNQRSGGTSIMPADDDDGFSDFAAAPVAPSMASNVATSVPHGVDRNAPLDMGLFGAPDEEPQQAASGAGTGAPTTAPSALAAAGITTMETQERVYVKGDQVMYRQRDGTEARAVVMAVDKSIRPYSYGIRMDITGTERETEGQRLRPVAAVAAAAAPSTPLPSEAPPPAAPGWLGTAAGAHHHQHPQQHQHVFPAAVARYDSSDFGDFAGPAHPTPSPSSSMGPTAAAGASAAAAEGIFGGYGSYAAAPAPAPGPTAAAEDDFGDFESFAAAPAPIQTHQASVAWTAQDPLSVPPVVHQTGLSLPSRGGNSGVSPFDDSDFGGFESAAPSASGSAAAASVSTNKAPQPHQGGPLSEDLFSAEDSSFGGISAGGGAVGGDDLFGASVAPSKAPVQPPLSLGAFSSDPFHGFGASPGTTAEAPSDAVMSLGDDGFGALSGAVAEAAFPPFGAAEMALDGANAPLAPPPAPISNGFGFGGLSLDPFNRGGGGASVHGLENGCEGGGDDGFGDFESFTAAEAPAAVAPKAAASVAAVSDGPRNGPLDLSLFGDDDMGLDNAPISLETPPAPAPAPAPAAGFDNAAPFSSRGIPGNVFGNGDFEAFDDKANDVDNSSAAGGKSWSSPHDGIGEDAWDGWAAANGEDEVTGGGSADEWGGPVATPPSLMGAAAASSSGDDAWSNWDESAPAAPPPDVAAASTNGGASAANGWSGSVMSPPPPGVAVASGGGDRDAPGARQSDTEDLFAAQAAEEMFAAEAAASASSRDLASAAKKPSSDFAPFRRDLDDCDVAEQQPDDMFQAFSEIPNPSYDAENDNSFAAFSSAEPSASSRPGTRDASFADSNNGGVPEPPAESDWASDAFAAFPTGPGDDYAAESKPPPGGEWGSGDFSAFPAGSGENPAADAADDLPPSGNGRASGGFSAFPAGPDMDSAAESSVPGNDWAPGGFAGPLYSTEEAAPPDESDWAAEAFAESDAGYAGPAAFIKSENLRRGSLEREDESPPQSEIDEARAESVADSDRGDLDMVRGKLSFEQPSASGASRHVPRQEASVDPILALRGDAWCALLEAARRVLQEADDWFQAVQQGGLLEEVAESPRVRRYMAEVARVAFVWKAVSLASASSPPLPPPRCSDTCERLSGLCEEAWGEHRQKQQQAEEQDEAAGGAEPGIPFAGSLCALCTKCCSEDGEEQSLAMATWEPTEKLREKMKLFLAEEEGCCVEEVRCPLSALPMATLAGVGVASGDVMVEWGPQRRRCFAPIAALWSARVSQQEVDVLE